MPRARIAIALAVLIAATLSAARPSSGNQNNPRTHYNAVRRLQVAQKAQRVQVENLKHGIVFFRSATWRWQDQVERPHTSTSYVERRVSSASYLKWAAKLWQHRWRAAKHYAQSIFTSRGYLPPSQARLLGRYLAAQQGWTGPEWECLDRLWGTKNGQTLESGWKVTADNPTSPAYGIPQADPGSKMARFGSNWVSSAYVQIRWGISYVLSAYRTPCHALSVRLAQHSY